MSGILNKKQRLIDLVVTKHGRSKIASGKFNPSFASFSDKHTNYFEAGMKSQNFADYSKVSIETETSLNSDIIVFENDDSGRIFINTATDEGLTVIGNKIFVKDPNDLNLTGSQYRESLTSALTGSVFDAAANKILSSSFKNLKSNVLVASNVLLGESNEFKMAVTDNKNYFAITNSSPFRTGPYGKTTTLEASDPLMFDSKLSHLRNFLYLPPINTDGSSYGTYQDLRNTSKLSYEDIKDDLNISSLNYDYLEQLLQLLYAWGVYVRS